MALPAVTGINVYAQYSKDRNSFDCCFRFRFLLIFLGWESFIVCCQRKCSTTNRKNFLLACLDHCVHCSRFATYIRFLCIICIFFNSYEEQRMDKMCGFDGIKDGMLTICFQTVQSSDDFVNVWMHTNYTHPCCQQKKKTVEKETFFHSSASFLY